MLRGGGRGGKAEPDHHDCGNEDGEAEEHPWKASLIGHTAQPIRSRLVLHDHVISCLGSHLRMLQVGSGRIVNSCQVCLKVI